MEWKSNKKVIELIEHWSSEQVLRNAWILRLRKDAFKNCKTDAEFRQCYSDCVLQQPKQVVQMLYHIDAMQLEHPVAYSIEGMTSMSVDLGLAEWITFEDERSKGTFLHGAFVAEDFKQVFNEKQEADSQKWIPWYWNGNKKPWIIKKYNSEELLLGLINIYGVTTWEEMIRCVFVHLRDDYMGNAENFFRRVLNFSALLRRQMERMKGQIFFFSPFVSDREWMLRQYETLKRRRPFNDFSKERLWRMGAYNLYQMFVGDRRRSTFDNDMADAQLDINECWLAMQTETDFDYEEYFRANVSKDISATEQSRIHHNFVEACLHFPLWRFGGYSISQKAKKPTSFRCGIKQ